MANQSISILLDWNSQRSSKSALRAGPKAKKETGLMTLRSGSAHQSALKGTRNAYSWYNMSREYNNSKLKCKKKSDRVWKTLTFPDGMYDCKDTSKFV